MKLLKLRRVGESAAHRAQADALEIEAAAKRRLADEYDAAQERGEVAGSGFKGNQWSVPEGNAPVTVTDLGLTRKQVHEARQLRDAETADPGVIPCTLDSQTAVGTLLVCPLVRIEGMVPTQAYRDLQELYEELQKKRRAQVPNVTTALRANPLDPENEFGKLMTVQEQLEAVDRMMQNERTSWLLVTQQEERRARLGIPSEDEEISF